MSQALLEGRSRIAGSAVEGRRGFFRAQDPATEGALEPPFSYLDSSQVSDATAAAEAAAVGFAALSPVTHARLLDTIAEEIESRGRQIIERAMAETALSNARLSGELVRTTSQLRMFARVVRRGDFRGVRIDRALPQRTPLPRPDIRQRKVPLGPVAVFGASNFPLAFSVAGGDTASALAAGCPVVFKAHNAHPGTSEIVGRTIDEAIASMGLDAGIFSLVFGEGNSVGQQLVGDPLIQAVAFTGSRAGGLSLAGAAAARPVPIPVFAEMSAVNPVLVLPGALLEESDRRAMATGCVGSIVGSSGQLCTAPGLIFVPSGDNGDQLLDAVVDEFMQQPGQTMLTTGIARTWVESVEAREDVAGVEILARGLAGPNENAPAPVLMTTSASVYASAKSLQAEIFGATALVVRYDSPEELGRIVRSLEGQLTVTLRAGASDRAVVADLLPVLERRAGRIVMNGWPTGVDVGEAIVHGGPFPATSDARSTSVGTLAIERFLRLVCYQGFDDEALPVALQDANPWDVPRREDPDPQPRSADGR